MSIFTKEELMDAYKEFIEDPHVLRKMPKFLDGAKESDLFHQETFFDVHMVFLKTVLGGAFDAVEIPSPKQVAMMFLAIEMCKDIFAIALAKKTEVN